MSPRINALARRPGKLPSGDAPPLARRAALMASSAVLGLPELRVGLAAAPRAARISSMVRRMFAATLPKASATLGGTCPGEAPREEGVAGNLAMVEPASLGERLPEASAPRAVLRSPRTGRRGGVGAPKDAERKSASKESGLAARSGSPRDGREGEGVATGGAGESSSGREGGVSSSKGISLGKRAVGELGTASGLAGESLGGSLEERGANDSSSPPRGGALAWRREGCEGSDGSEPSSSLSMLRSSVRARAQAGDRASASRRGRVELTVQGERSVAARAPRLAQCRGDLGLGGTPLGDAGTSTSAWGVPSAPPSIRRPCATASRSSSIRCFLTR